LKKSFIFFMCFMLNIFGQEASDYYNRPLQELLEKIPGQVQDTTLVHSGGLLQSYYTLQQWAYEKRDDHLKSVCHYDSICSVQLILHSDCQAQKANGPVFEYYMALTSFSKSIKIEFWNINPKLKDCDKLYRKSLESEVINLIRSFVDSTQYIHKPCTGYSPKKIIRISIDTSHKDIDSIFDCVIKDSIAQHIKDSINEIKNVAPIPIESQKINLDSANKIFDSLSTTVDADSVILYRAEPIFFKKQISCKGSIDIDTRLQCVGFFLTNKLRSSEEMSKYLMALQKFCVDKCEMIKVLRLILPDEQKYKAVATFHKIQNDCKHIEDLVYQIAVH
jgi:hypothetical protein